MDFSKADVFDRRWWQKLDWLMDQLEETGLREVYKLQHLQHSLLMPLYTDTSRAEMWEKVNDLRSRYIDSMFPWVKKSQPEAKERTQSVQALQQQWAEIWGNPDSPETQRKIQRTVQALEPRMRK